MKRILLSLALAPGVASCSSSTSSPAQPAPTITRQSSPKALTLLETERAETSFTLLSGAVLSSHADPVEGLEVEVKDDADSAGDSTGRTVKVSVRASWGAVGSKKIVITSSAPSAGELRTDVDVEVKPLLWTPTTKWGSEGPQAREHGALIVDEKQQRVILVGGSGYSPYGTPLDDVWSFSLFDHKWTKATTEGDLPAAGGSRRVARVDDANVYLFGGYGDASAVDDFLYRADISTKSVKFKKLTHSGGAPARSLHAFAYDRKGNRFVVFGGASSKPLNDTWTMTVTGDTVAWSKVDATGPSARYGFFYGFDEDTRRLAVWSGAQAFSTVKPAQDTWVLDLASEPPAWSAITVGDANAPTGRRNGCFVYDPGRTTLFVFGGTADAKVTEPGFFALDLRPGKEAWTKLVRDGEPPLRSSGIGYYDPTTKTIACGFGNTTGGVFTDFTAFGP